MAFARIFGRVITEAWRGKFAKAFALALPLAAVLSGVAWNGVAAEGAFRPLEGELQIHDPSTIIRCGDQYWVFGTGAGVLSRSSKDLVRWTEGPRVFQTAPPWAEEVNPRFAGRFWAPDIIKIGADYLLYFSVSSWGSRESAIGLARSASLDPGASEYGWRDAGIVVKSSNLENFNAIDPAVFLDRDNRLWLTFGSYWSGIKLVELDPKTGLTRSTNSPMHDLAWHESIEAPCIYRHGENYFLVVNWGQCCRGTNSTYEIRVGRSEAIIGPYLDREGKDMLHGGGTLFLGTHGNRIGPGHAGFLTVDGKEYISFHFYDAGLRGRARLDIAPLQWTGEGWPEVVASTQGSGH